MSDITCKNCETALSPDPLFCPRCGQKTHTKRLNMAHIWHEMIHVLTHADKGILFLTKEMALRPGIVAKEYVEGKRKKYFNPFSYVVLTVAVSAFLTVNFNLMAIDESQAMHPATKLVTKHINLIFLISVPIIAAFHWLFFMKDRYNYAEQLSFSAFMGGFRIVFFVLIFTPLVLLFRDHYFQMLSIYMGLWLIFSCWANTQFFSGAKWLTVLKTVLVLMLTQFTITFLIILAIRTLVH